MPSRRGVLKAGVVASGLLLARPLAGLVPAGAAEPAPFPAGRRSRLFPGNGTFVVHSDLHNHTLLSDGATRAADAFALMRDAGLDVAALTDHAVFGEPAANLCAHRCSQYAGIDEAAWRELRTLADESNEDGAFVALRGFEWTTGTIGHVNVWFTEQWVDALRTGGLQSTRGLPVLVGTVGDPDAQAALSPLFASLPETATMDLFYEWLQSEPSRPVLGGGADGVAGFNHPNLYGDFEAFKYVPGLVERMVSCEALNGTDDYLFWGVDEGRTSPLNACLNAGWRVGMLGVSDEHGDDWADGKARGGLWVRSLTRDGVREALEARRFFATFEPGLRLDAAANGVQMGRSVPHRSGPVRFHVDLAGGLGDPGRPLLVQVLRPGTDVPEIAHTAEVRTGTVSSFEADVDVADGRWVLLRVTDRAKPADRRATPAYRPLGGAVAYASPFFLDPDVTA